MSILDWHPFLEQWSHELLDDADYRAVLPPEVVASGWLGFPGATEQEITEAEARLGTRFPPSYRSFLSVTNGWRRTAPRMERLWSTTELEWFPVRHQEWIDIWVEESEDLPLLPKSSTSSMGRSRTRLRCVPSTCRPCSTSARWGTTTPPSTSSIHVW